MIPFEFTISGPPVSAQTRNCPRLQHWKQEVRAAAQARVPAGAQPTTDTVQVTITYYYEGDTPDVDNIIKPIQDALVGVVFVDEARFHDSMSSPRNSGLELEAKGERTAVSM
jgi:crossover junction endodeoxyribonuclease RusA